MPYDPQILALILVLLSISNGLIRWRCMSMLIRLLQKTIEDLQAEIKILKNDRQSASKRV